MADKKISALTAATTPLAGTEVLPIVQSGSTVKVANNDLRPKQVQSNATSGVMQIVGPAAAATRVMTIPDANFTVARTDAGQTFTGVNTFTSPKVITSMDDTNGNEIFKITATGSAVNEFTVANAATGNGPTLSATGSDANIDAFITPKGTGDVRVTNALRFRSSALDMNGRLACQLTSVSTVATEISPYGGTWGHLVIVTGLDGVGNFFTDLVFSAATAGPTVLSAKTISGSPAGRTYSMSGSDKLQLAMASGTYDVYASFLYGLS